MWTVNQTQLACRALIAITALAMFQGVAQGQATCPCQPNPIVSQPAMTVTSRLPDSWPRQWGDPVLPESSGKVAPSALKRNGQFRGDIVGLQDSRTSSSMRVNAGTRDPFTGAWFAAGSQIRWSRSGQTGTSATGAQQLAAAGESSKSTPRSDKSPSESKTSDAGTSGFSSGAAYGGSSSFGGPGGVAAGGSSGGGMSGGSSGGFSGGFSGGSASIPRSSGSSGGMSGGFSGGTGGGSGGSAKSEVIPTPDPHSDHGGGLAVIPPPHCPVPPVLPEIPPTGGNPVPPPDHDAGHGVGEAPIVPEPGGIVLLSIAMGVCGAGYIRRRRRLSLTPARV